MDLPQLDGVTHRTVPARGLRFHVAEAGAGEPIVLVHGWPQHWWMWRHVVPLLAPHARLVMIDLRGFGWSDAPPGAYDKQTLADDLLAVLDALGLERVGLMAHDWGAWSGFLACLAAPERFAAFLALGAPRPGGRPSARQLREVWRFAYQVAIAAPMLGRRLVADPRFIERTIMAGAVQPAGVDARRPARLHDGAGRAGPRAGQRAPLPDVPRARGRPQPARTPARADAHRGRRRDPAIPAVLLDGAQNDADDVSRRDRRPSAGTSSPKSSPALVAERAREPSSGRSDQKTWPKA